MSTDIALAEQMGLQLSSNFVTDDAFATLIGDRNFLPRLQVFGGNSDACKEGKIPIGMFGLVERKQIENISNEISVFILGQRFKALRMGEKVEVFYNPQDPEFLKIYGESKVKNSKSLCGMEYLLWLPDSKRYVTFYMASNTLLGEVDKMKKKLGGWVTLKTDLKANKTYKWHGILVLACSLDLPLGNPTEMKRQNAAFVNATKETVDRSEFEGEEATTPADPDARVQ